MNKLEKSTRKILHRSFDFPVPATIDARDLNTADGKNHKLRPGLSTEDVANRVLATMQDMLQRPEMYSSTPESMEETLMALDQVRELLIHGNSDELPAYTRFLIQQGFGSSNFTCRWSQTHPDQDVARRFQALVSFYTEYLKTLPSKIP